MVVGLLVLSIPLCTIVVTAVVAFVVKGVIHVSSNGRICSSSSDRSSSGGGGRVSSWALREKKRKQVF